MPPRTTSKPLISVTAQSSTESTQDAYQDSRAQRMSPWPQDGRSLYNSTDSLDSNKAMNLALETAAQRLASEGQTSSTRTSDKAILASKAEEFLKSRRSSIGIQVPLSAAPWRLLRPALLIAYTEPQPSRSPGSFAVSERLSRTVRRPEGLRFPLSARLRSPGLLPAPTPPQGISRGHWLLRERGSRSF